MSGIESTTHLGGLAVGVPITAASSAFLTRSRNRSSQAKSKFSSSGSKRLQANSPTRTKRMPRSCILRDPQANDFLPMFQVVADPKRRGRTFLSSIIKGNWSGGESARFGRPSTELDRSADGPRLFSKFSWRPSKLLPEWPLRSWLSEGRFHRAPQFTHLRDIRHDYPVENVLICSLDEGIFGAHLVGKSL